jgi:hypothetical protein
MVCRESADDTKHVQKGAASDLGRTLTMPDARWFFTCPTCTTRYSWTGPQQPIPPCPKCKAALEAVAAAQQAKPAEQPAATKTGVRIPLAGEQDLVTDALGLCEEIESLAAEVPEAGEDFAMSVLEKANDIQATIEETKRATRAQVQALENMRDGLSRWIRE